MDWFAKNKWFVLVVVLTAVILVESSLWWIYQEAIRSRNVQWQQRTQEIMQTRARLSPTPTPLPEYVRMHATTGDRRFEAEVRARHMGEGVYTATMSAHAVDGLERVLVDEDQETIKQVWSGEVVWDDLVRVAGAVDYEHWRGFDVISGGENEAFEWGDDGRLLALVWSDRLVVATFKDIGLQLRDVNWIGGERLVTVTQLQAVKEFPVALSGRGRKLVIDGNGRTVYWFDSADTTFLGKYELNGALGELVFPGELGYANAFPIPGSSSLASWVNAGSNRHGLLIWGGSLKKRYNFEEEFDYPGKLLVSPGSRHVCYESGSSGSWWATVKRLADDATLFGGRTYTYCKRWLDENRLVLVDRGYNSEMATWLLLDVRTGATTVLDVAD